MRITHHVYNARQQRVKHIVLSCFETRAMDMHASTARLYQAATRNGKTPRQSELARALNISPQTLKNWESRGLSVPGALLAESVYGASPTWLLTGKYPARRPHEPAQTPVFTAHETTTAWPLQPSQTAEILVSQLALRLERLPEEAQRSAQSALSALAGAPDSKRARDALARALDAHALEASPAP